MPGEVGFLETPNQQLRDCRNEDGPISMQKGSCVFTSPLNLDWILLREKIRTCRFDSSALCVLHFVSVHVTFQMSTLQGFILGDWSSTSRQITSLDMTGGRTLQEESASSPSPQP